MLLPNKVIGYNQSVISKFPIILKQVQLSEINVQDLKSKTETFFEGTSDFVQTLDTLYALGKIELTKEGAIKCL